MNKLLRLAGTAVLVILAIRVLDWLLAPTLPMFAALFVIGLVLYIAITGRRGL